MSLAQAANYMEQIIYVLVASLDMSDISLNEDLVALDLNHDTFLKNGLHI